MVNSGGRYTSSSPVTHSSSGTGVIGTSIGTSSTPSAHSPHSSFLGAGFLGRATVNVMIASKIATAQKKTINYF